MKHYFLLFLVAGMVLVSCGQGGNSGAVNGAKAGNTPANPGKLLFANNCLQCHSLKQDKMGPKLDGVMSRWNNDSLKVVAFIRNSQKVISSDRDGYVTHLYHNWANAMMPAFDKLSDQEIQQILGYIHTGVE